MQKQKVIGISAIVNESPTRAVAAQHDRNM
jgi:hypothetical protein